jgi:hypothetical protein
MPSLLSVPALERKEERSRAKKEDGELGCKNARIREHESTGHIPSTLSTHDVWENVMRGAWCLHPLRNLP